MIYSPQLTLPLNTIILGVKLLKYEFGVGGPIMGLVSTKVVFVALITFFFFFFFWN
jgi:hypothetical protein